MMDNQNSNYTRDCPVETKFHTLQPWLDEILGSIRKDIKTDYLPGSATFYRTYFKNRPQSRLKVDEIHAAFKKELLAGNEEMSEWVVNRWVFKHADVYRHFQERLFEINPDFSSIQILSQQESEQVLNGAKEALGAKNIYFFSVLNDVVFPRVVLDRLREEALAEAQRFEEEEKIEIQQADLAKIVERQQRDIVRITEKYEQKLAGVLKKYSSDTEALKRQVRSLQQKLGEKV